MTEIHHKYIKPKDTIFYKVAFFSIISIYGYDIVQEVHTLIDVYSSKRMILLLLLSLIVSGVLFMILQIILLRKEYDLIDFGKEVVIDNKDRQILIRQGSKERVIKNEEIKSSEVYESWIAAYPLGSFKFIKIILKSGENFLITGFTLPLLESDLSAVLKGTEKKVIRRLFNRSNNCC